MMTPCSFLHVREGVGGGVGDVVWAWPFGLRPLPVATSYPALPLLLGAEAWLPLLDGSRWDSLRSGLDDGHLPHDLCVTKNPRSPKVWSAGESSRGGRGGSRSTAQSSPCLEGETLSQSPLRQKISVKLKTL